MLACMLSVCKVASIMSDSVTPDCSPPGSSVHGILQERILEWVAMPFTSEEGELNPMTSNNTRDRHTGKKAIWRQRQWLKWCSYKSTNTQLASSHQKLQERQEKFFPQELQKASTVSIPWIRISGLPNCERVNFCCFKQRSLW